MSMSAGTPPYGITSWCATCSSVSGLRHEYLPGRETARLSGNTSTCQLLRAMINTHTLDQIVARGILAKARRSCKEQAAEGWLLAGRSVIHDQSNGHD